MKIHYLKVKNFKSLFNGEINGCCSVNFIHGYNNSGKSNFLKFLDLLFCQKTVRAPEEYLDENNVRRIRSKIVQYTPFWNGYIYNMPYIYYKNIRDNKISFEVALMVKSAEVPHSPELIAAGYLYPGQRESLLKIFGEIVALDQSDSQMILKKVILKGKTIFSENQGVNRFFEQPVNSPLANNEAIFNELMDLFTNCVMLIESERFFSKELLLAEPPENFEVNGFKNWLYGISLDADKYEKFNNLVEFLNRFNVTSRVAAVLDDNLLSYPFSDTKMGFAKFKNEIEVMLTNPFGRYPLKNFGTGVQQLLFILTKIYNSNSKIVLIEELELNLSPEYQELIINNLQAFLLENRISQVFFTSHSDYLHRGDFKVYEVKIDTEGKSTINPSSYTGLKALRRGFLQLAEN